MALVEINTNPTDRQLRQFGWISFIAFPLLAWLWAGTILAVAIAGGAGLVLAFIGQIVPKWLKPLFVVLILLSMPIGLIVGEVLLLMLFVFLFTPMAIVFRLIGRDVLMLRRPKDTSTFWVVRKPVTDVRQYYRQW
jgi:hypothetical protein